MSNTEQDMKQLTSSETASSRRRFLQRCGTLVAGGSILGLSGLLLRGMTTRKKEEPLCELTQKPIAGVKKECADCKQSCPLRQGVSF